MTIIGQDRGNVTPAYLHFLKMLMVFLVFFVLPLSSFSQGIPERTIVNQVPSTVIDLTEEEKAWIAEHPVLRATNEMDWAPLDFLIGDEPQGFSIDYLNLVAEKVGLEINYLTGLRWDKQLEMLENKEIDIAHSIILTEGREKYLNFTRPYLDLPMVYFGRIGAPRINSLEDLEDKRIGGVKGDIANDIYKNNFPHFNLIEYDRTLEALKELSAGSIDVFADLLPVTSYIMEKNLISGIEVIGDRFYPETGDEDYIRLAARKDWPILVSILEKGMAAITEQEFKNLSDKWHTRAPIKHEIDLTASEVNWLAENRVIKVAADPTATPLETIDENGEISGIAGAYLEKISERLGVKFEWVGNSNWAEGVELIKAGKADMVSAANSTAARREYLTFTGSFLTVSHMIFAREGGEVFGNMDGLAGYKISQISGFAVARDIEKDYPDIEIVYADDVTEALKLVATGEVDAYVGSIPMAAHAIANEGLTQIIVVGDTPYRGENAMGIRSELPLLASAMQKAMRSITTRERAEISREWLAIAIEDQQNSILLRNIIIVSVIVVFIIMVWNSSLRREVNYRKEIEKKLKLSQEKAEAAQLEAEAANTAKSNFLANMSHEIRTPLNAIIGFSDAMLMGIHGRVKEPEYQEYLNDIKNSGEHLATVIKDILDLSKIEAGKWRLQEEFFSLEECIDAAVKMLRPQAEKKNINLISTFEDEDKDIDLFGDVHAIKRAIINLLSNAIKFTDEKGEVSCYLKLNPNGSILVEITDNGIGIPKSRLEHVMNPFEQVHEAHDVNEEGTGLGLPIVKKLIELHGGEFSLLSRVNKGTKARIIFPSHRSSVSEKQQSDISLKA